MTRTTAILILLAACGQELTVDPGPPPTDQHQATIRATIERVVGARYPLDGQPQYGFAAPRPGRVARWHWESQSDGYQHTAGYHHGWCVEFRFTPRLVGFPAQPEAMRMAFFRDGELRGLFMPGGDDAPFELDRWAPVWLDEAWSPPGAAPR